MTADDFLILLISLSTISSLITEAIKRFQADWASGQTSSNIIVLLVSIVVGIGGTMLYAEQTGTYVAMTDAVVMVLAVWLCAMLGYDKVIQTLEQIGGNDGSIK